MSFTSKADEATSTINIYKPHQAFVAKLLEITEGDAHVMPTAKNKDPNPDATSSTKSPIIAADTFPKTTYLHGLFFETLIYYNEKSNRTVVKIKHQVLMKEPVHVVKRKMIEFLRTNKMWLKSGDLDAVETSGFGWFFAAHNSMVHRPALKIVITNLIKALPPDIVQKAIKDYGTPEDELSLPEIFLNPKWQAFGNTPNRVQTHAVTISCVINKIRLMKELVCLIPRDMMPFQFVHIGLATTNHPDVYWKSIVANNDNQNAVQGVTVKGFSAELLQKRMENKAKVTASVATHFLNFPSIISIEETHKTQECGRYIFIVLKKDFVAAQAHISEFCASVFSTLYTEEEKDIYRATYQHLPHLVASPTAGGAVGANGDYLAQMLAKVEKGRGQPYSIANGSYASKVAPRIIIEHESEFEFPPLQSKTTRTNNQDNTSVVTNNSSSTIAATKTGVTLSGQTLASQDVSVAISEMKSIMSSMFDRQEKFLRESAAKAEAAAKEAKQEAKEAAAEAKKEAQAAAIEAKKDAMEAAAIARKEAADATDRMQNFLTNMIHMMLGAKDNSTQKYPTPLSKRKRAPDMKRHVPTPSTTYGPHDEPEPRFSSEDEAAHDDMIQDDEDDEEMHHDMDDSKNYQDDVYVNQDGEYDNEEIIELFTAEDEEDDDEEQEPSETDSAEPKESKASSPPPKKHDARPSPARHQPSTPPTSLKMQRTGTAPTKPSRADLKAKALDFDSIKSDVSVPAAPDPQNDSPSQQ